MPIHVFPPQTGTKGYTDLIVFASSGTFTQGVDCPSDVSRFYVEVWGAGAVTVAPYLGSDSVTPFTTHQERGIFLLCHTSNPSAGELQTLQCGGELLYRRIARLAQGWDEAHETTQIGLVIGATYPKALMVPYQKGER